MKKKFLLYFIFEPIPGIKKKEFSSLFSKAIERVCRIVFSAKLNSSAINIFPCFKAKVKGPSIITGNPF